MNRALGQVFTPPAVAAFMVAWAARNRPREILDPCLGRGVFANAWRTLQRRQQLAPLARLTACEIDPALAAAASAPPSEPLPIDLHRGDFLAASFARRFDAIACNPPYVRHHDLRQPANLLARLERASGCRLSRSANLYAWFLLRIWDLLAPRGRAAVITPAEWLNADFGRSLKAHFLRHNALDAIVHFDAATPVFADALTTSAIFLLRRDRRPHEPIRVRWVRALDDLGIAPTDRALNPAELDPNAKWTPLLRDARAAPRAKSTAATRLADVARCVRGIATGANRYFVLTPRELAAAGIDRADVRLCLSKASHAPAERLTRRDIARLVATNQRVFLLDPRRPLRRAVQRYLARGRAAGIDRRYLPSHRPVWYRPERRAAAPIWVTVFARSGFRFVRNQPAALALTAFHAIYPRPGICPDALHAALCDAARRGALRPHVRSYAAGLDKLEPRDVEQIVLPDGAASLRPPAAPLSAGRPRSASRSAPPPAGRSRPPAAPSCPGSRNKPAPRTAAAPPRTRRRRSAPAR